MCDTIVVVAPDGVLFAKNSDRDPNEAQVVEWHAGTDHDPGTTVRCTHVEIPQAARTLDIVIARPYWMWGAEMGTNCHGVTIGNEAVFTDQPYADTGLTGMDLVRLGLERAESAESAVGVIVSLLEEHGQGGGCGHEKRSFTYHNSFLVADPARAFVLETAGRLWEVEEVYAGVRSISNGLTIREFAARHRDRLRTRVAACDVRINLTERLASGAVGPGDLFGVLRSHGPGEWPRYRLVNGTLAMPCMHGGGVVAGSLTTGAWVADLRRGLHWVTATSSPCLSLFKPITVRTPLDLGPKPTDRFDGATVWWRHEALSRAVMRNPQDLALFLGERDAMERRWLKDVPAGDRAFAQAAEATEAWAERATAAVFPDVRPWWVRRYWEKRDRRAGIGSDRA